ncbi:GNAT family N-acetyltransferase [Marinicellulosiphila megalodicopiae]|uniref:GNAT family N-acetyltransferase n=1 Tax=Marinicellulosiphila megalodicopiae TaxID=2724896 RepID=UPI003BAF21DB
MNKINICKANVQDAPIILEIQKQAYISEAELNNDFNIPPLTQTLEELIAEFDNKLILKIVKDDQIIGSGQAQLHGSTCHIGRMAVKSEFKGQGIGSQLLSTLESSFIEADRVELFTGKQSKANLAMYARRGYEVFKQEKLGQTQVVFLYKNLNQ